jgi:DNA repair exonuclease SbcCD ATPase subunit
MSEFNDAPQPTDAPQTTYTEPQRTFSGAFLAAVAVAVIAALAALVWSYVLNGRISRQETALADANQQNARLAADLRETDARLRVATDELSRSLGLTQKQLEQRAQAIIQRENADSRRLQAAQQQTAQQVSAVSSDLSNVKTDVGGVKTDVAKTQADLATTISQLQSMRGDLNGASTLIARNHDELVALEHKGDRNYYEFSLDKDHRKPVGTVSLELRKADPKHSKFTLWVFADDRRYEKKDRNVNEPLQFYSGKQPTLYEIVVNNIEKNRVSGYLSTPKGAPVPAVTGQ